MGVWGLEKKSETALAGWPGDGIKKKSDTALRALRWQTSAFVRFNSRSDLLIANNLTSDF